MCLLSQLLGRLKPENRLSLGNGGCSGLRLCHCTPVWVTEGGSVSKKFPSVVTVGNGTINFILTMTQLICQNAIIIALQTTDTLIQTFLMNVAKSSWVGGAGYLREAQSHGEDVSTDHMRSEEGLEQGCCMLSEMLEMMPFLTNG